MLNNNTICLVKYSSLNVASFPDFNALNGCVRVPSSSLHPLDSIAGLLDLSLLYHLWISASFLLFTWHITLLLFRVFVTEVSVADCNITWKAFNCTLQVKFPLFL